MNILFSENAQSLKGLRLRIKNLLEDINKESCILQELSQTKYKDNLTIRADISRKINKLYTKTELYCMYDNTYTAWLEYSAEAEANKDDIALWRTYTKLQRDTEKDLINLYQKMA